MIVFKKFVLLKKYSVKLANLLTTRFIKHIQRDLVPVKPFALSHVSM